MLCVCYCVFKHKTAYGMRIRDWSSDVGSSDLKAFGVEQAFLTTLHSVMNDQPMIDGYHHSDLRRTRSAMQSIIPVSTGLAQGVERLLPELGGKIQAKAIRVPILNVSAIDLMVNLRHEVTAATLN